MGKEDIDKAVEILRRWRLAVMNKHNEAAQKETEHVMKVLEFLYNGKVF